MKMVLDEFQFYRLSCKKRLNIADVPVGVLLSYGLDSSLITAISKNI